MIARLRRSSIGMLVAVLILSDACSVEVSPVRSRALFETTLNRALQGDLTAAATLGDLYRRGVGVPPDPEKAIEWYERGGSHGGWLFLGLAYEEGDGVPKDVERAAYYLGKAAETGSPVAMYQLACMYADRRIRTGNPVDGYMWSLLARDVAKSLGRCPMHYQCKYWALKDRPGCRATFEALLTPEQKTDAEQRATAWLAAHPGRR